MAFYTCVNRYGNSILYRGYSSDGRPVIKKEKFEPTLFVPTNVQDSEWKALDGSNVEPMHFPSMREAQEFVKTYEGVDNFEIHGNTNYVAQYIQEKFPNDIHFDIKMVNVGYIDIEVLSEEGFPEPDKAAYPIVSIAYKSSKANHFRVWTLADFDPINMELDLNGRIVKYMKFNSEEELLDNFLIWWTENSPDVVTGWNSRLFDIPYIINRTMRILGEKEAKRMSPWKVIRYREIKMKFSSMDAYEIYGVQQMDYMDLFKKFGHGYGIPENHALDTIATLVLDEKKLSYDEYGSLHELYKQNPQKYIEYNIRDVDLVEKINDDSHLLELALMIAFKGGVNFSDAFGTTGIWDSFIYRHLTPKKIAIPFGEFKRKTEYPGGYVKDVIPGMKDWVVSFDLASLYPNIIVQYNMSPETLVRGIVEPNGVEHFLENAPDEKDYTVAANGVRFRKDKRGMMPEIIVGLYAERRKVKDEMLEVDREIQKLKKLL